MNRYMYLFGKNSTLPDAVESFVHMSGGRDAKLVLLTVKKGGWEKHVPRYTEQWKQLGVSHIEVIAVGDTEELSDKMLNRIREATGIFIGGGHTETYHEMYACDPVKLLLIEKYTSGVPIAGCSAGALILPKVVVISPNDNDDKKLKIVDGVGLLSSILIAVHYSQWKEKEHIVEAMKKTGCHYAIGLDEEAALLLCNEEFHRTFGPEQVYTLTYSLEEGCIEQSLKLFSM
jgi:cyanophycinase